MERRLRKYDDCIIISGIGIMIFSFWNILKGVLYATIGREYFLDKIGIIAMITENESLEKIESEGLTKLENEYVTWIFILLFFFMVVQLLLRYFVFKSGIAEAKGKKKGWFYIILAIIMLAIDVFNLATSFAPAANLKFDVDFVVSALVELTSILAMLEFIVTAILAKKIRKELRV